jgi:hypothetical protein
MIQIDCIKRHVYIEMADQQAVVKLLQDTTGRVECKHTKGEPSHVTLTTAGMGYKSTRVANLPPEVPDDDLKPALAPYGQIIDIKAETWYRSYRYVVANGIRQVAMSLQKTRTI